MSKTEANKKNKNSKQKNEKILKIFLIILGVIIAIYIIGLISEKVQIIKIENAIKKKDYATAKTLLDERLESTPNDKKGYLLYSDYYVAKEEYLKALGILEKGFKKLPNEKILKNKQEEIKDEYEDELNEEIRLIKEEEARKAEEAEQKRLEAEAAKAAQEAEQKKKEEEAKAAEAEQKKKEEERKAAEAEQKKKEEAAKKKLQEAEKKKEAARKAAEAKKAKETAIKRRTNFIKSTKKYNWKTLARYPEKYMNKPIRVKGEISQILKGGWFTEPGIRIYEDYDLYNHDTWLKKEWFLLTENAPKKPKLLEDDIVTFYGIYKGTQEVKRALTGVKETIPTMEVKYFTIHK